MTAALLAAAEALLALAGVKPGVGRADPYVGFTQRPLFVAEATHASGATRMRTADSKKRFFNDQSFLHPKPPGTFRIFTLGGSTTFGHPYHDSTSFSGWLRAGLRAVAPHRAWEVINAGGISYASYRVAALLDELLAYEPDLFVVYTGHNEFLEERTYAPVRARPRWEQEARAVLAHSRMYAALDDAARRARRVRLSDEVETLLDQSVGPEAYRRDDALRDHVVAHYRSNLERMVRAAREAAVPILFVTPASSLRDCSPFKSEATAGLSAADADAAADLRAAARRALSLGRLDDARPAAARAVALDPRHAGGRYLLAEILFSAGALDEADVHYAAARDEDVVPVRALTVLVETLRTVAEQTGVPCVDFVKILETDRRQAAGHGSPGQEWFLDHVHPTIEGNRVIAEAILDPMRSLGFLKPDERLTADSAATMRAEVEASLDPVAQGVALRNVAKVLSWAGKTSDAARLAGQAMAHLGRDAECLFLLGLDADERGHPEEAEAHYRKAVEADPGYVKALHNLGIALARQGRYPEAIEQYRRVLERSPDHPYARYNLGRALRRNGNDAEAIVMFRETLRRDRGDADARLELAELLADAGKINEAREQLREGLRWNPDHPETKEALALLP